MNEISKGKKKIKNLSTNTISNKTQIKLKNKKKDNFSACAVHYKRIINILAKIIKIMIKTKEISPYQNIKTSNWTLIQKVLIKWLL